MKKFFLLFLVAVLSLVTMSTAFCPPAEADNTKYEALAFTPAIKTTPLVEEYIPLTASPPEVTSIPVEPENDISDADIELLALMTMTEAEGEPEEGQRLVIDSVLNRIDDPILSMMSYGSPINTLVCSRPASTAVMSKTSSFNLCEKKSQIERITM